MYRVSFLLSVVGVSDFSLVSKLPRLRVLLGYEERKIGKRGMRSNSFCRERCNTYAKRLHAQCNSPPLGTRRRENGEWKADARLSVSAGRSIRFRFRSIDMVNYLASRREAVACSTTRCCLDSSRLPKLFSLLSSLQIVFARRNSARSIVI